MDQEVKAAVSLCLSKAEVAEYTRAKTKAKQVRMLVSNGIRHTIDCDGWPVVTRLAIEGERERGQDKAWKPRKAA